MTIQKKEIKKIISLFFLFLGLGLLIDPLKAFLIGESMNPIVFGIIILAIGSYLFKY